MPSKASLRSKVTQRSTKVWPNISHQPYLLQNLCAEMLIISLRRPFIYLSCQQAHEPLSEPLPVEIQGSEVPAASLYSQQNFLGCCLKAGKRDLTNSAHRLAHTSWKTQHSLFNRSSVVTLKAYVSIKLFSKCTAQAKPEWQIYLFPSIFSISPQESVETTL